MRICVKTSKDTEWKRDCSFIRYGKSRLNDPEEQAKRYYELQFTYDFKNKDDKVYFAYCIPYTFSKMQQHLKILVTNPDKQKFVREEHFCYSLSGVSVPIITVTSNIDRLGELGC